MMSVDLSPPLLHSLLPHSYYLISPPLPRLRFTCLRNYSASLRLQKLENWEQTPGSASATGLTLSLAEAPDPTCCLRPPTHTFPEQQAAAPDQQLSAKRWIQIRLNQTAAKFVITDKKYPIFFSKRLLKLTVWLSVCTVKVFWRKAAQLKRSK